MRKVRNPKEFKLPELRNKCYLRLYLRVCDMYDAGLVDFMFVRLVVLFLNSIDDFGKVKIFVLPKIYSLLDSVESSYNLIYHLRRDIDSYLDDIHKILNDK